jgi:hypothetical protein
MKISVAGWRQLPKKALTGSQSGQGRRAGCFTTPTPDTTVLVQTDYGRVERTTGIG